MKRPKKHAKPHYGKFHHVSFPYNRDTGELPLRGVPTVYTNPHLQRNEPTSSKRSRPSPKPRPPSLETLHSQVYFQPYKNTNPASKGPNPNADPEIYRYFAELAYQKDLKDIDTQAMKRGWFLNKALSTDETKVFTNPDTRTAVMSFRGTVPTRWKDLRSDLAIATGSESSDMRFREALVHFDSVKASLGHQYAIDTVGHSLGGQLASHVNIHRPGEVRENLSFSRGSGVFEPLRTAPSNSWDYSHSLDPISLGARWSRGVSSHNKVDYRPASLLKSHDVKGLSHLTEPLSKYTPPTPSAKAVETSTVPGIRIM